MTDKQKHIAYWKFIASEDLEVVEYLIAGKRFAHARFFAHLSLEKILKAHWVKNSLENFPPKTHNLISLLEKTKLEIEEDDIDFLEAMNIYQIEGRYPNYQTKMHQSVQKSECEKIIPDVKRIFKCLQEKLP